MSSHQYNTKSLKTKTWFVIVNPVAAGGRVRNRWRKIKKELLIQEIEFDFCFSNYERHTILLTKNALQNGYRKILGVGGDGTLNEIVNGIFGHETIPDPSEVTVGVIPAGTGNDWIRSHNISKQYKEAIKNLRTNRTLLQDIGKISMTTEKGAFTHYYLNIAGIGFNASVVKNTRLISGKSFHGQYYYLLAMIISLIRYRPVDLVIDTGVSDEWRLSVFAMSIAICKFNGGGMMMAPHARYDDGLLSLTVVGKINKLNVIRNFFKLFDGSFINNKEVKIVNTQKLSVVAPESFGVEMDGELLGETKLITFENLSGKLRVISGNS